MKRICDPSSGKFGIAVYQGGRYGQVVRALAIPTNPRSAAQSLVRARMTTVSRAWQTLTQAQRDAWTSTALNVQSKPRLGLYGALTGSQLHMKINASLLEQGGAVVAVPPAIPEFSDLPISALVITNTGGTIAIKLSTTDSPPDGTMLAGAAPCSQGIARCPDTVGLGPLDSPVTNAITITTAYTARFGVPAVGKKVFVKVNESINGWQAYPTIFTAVVPAST